MKGKRRAEQRLVAVEHAIRDRIIRPDAGPSRPKAVVTEGRTFQAEPFREDEIRR